MKIAGHVSAEAQGLSVVLCKGETEAHKGVSVAGDLQVSWTCGGIALITSDLLACVIVVQRLSVCYNVFSFCCHPPLNVFLGI